MKTKWESIRDGFSEFIINDESFCGCLSLKEFVRYWQDAEARHKQRISFEDYMGILESDQEECDLYDAETAARNFMIYSLPE